MKTYLRFLILVLVLSPAFVSAQGDLEDVIYLKNGSVYKGTILDQEYGVSYKIQIRGGSVISIDAGDVIKVQREEKHSEVHLAKTFRYREHGYFCQMQLETALVGGGGSLTNGYKINQYAALGIGIGINSIEFSFSEPGVQQGSFSGIYFPMFLYLSGDMLKRKITPFYQAELGYAMANKGLIHGETFNSGNSYILRGGPMGSAGIGARFYITPMFNCSLSLDLDVQYAREKTYYYYGGSNSINATMLLPAFKFELGF